LRSQLETTICDVKSTGCPFAIRRQRQAGGQDAAVGVIATFLIKQAGLKRSEAHTGAVTLVQRFGSAANLKIPPALPVARWRVSQPRGRAGIP